VLFDKIASVGAYILFEKCNYILALEMASPGKQQCASCIGTLSFPTPRSEFEVKVSVKHTQRVFLGICQ